MGFLQTAGLIASPAIRKHTSMCNLGSAQHASGSSWLFLAAHEHHDTVVRGHHIARCQVPSRHSIAMHDVTACVQLNNVASIRRSCSKREGKEAGDQRLEFSSTTTPRLAPSQTSSPQEIDGPPEPQRDWDVTHLLFLTRSWSCCFSPPSHAPFLATTHIAMTSGYCKQVMRIVCTMQCRA